MKLIFTGLLLIHVSCCAQYNFESCLKFWDITEKLKNNQLPTEADWIALRNTEGYKRKNINNESWKKFTEKLSFAFRPSNKDSLTSKAATDFTYKYFKELVSQEDSLKQYVRDIYSFHRADSAIAYAKQNLPYNFRDCARSTSMYFLFWDYDGSASANQVVIDLLISYHMKTFKPAVFEAHEVYHSVLAACRIKTRQ